MADPSLFEGSSFLEERKSQSADLTPPSDNNMFDYNLVTDLDGVVLDSNFTNTFASVQQSQPQTVSPKDLMFDSMSAPPSGAYTDLTTPGTSTLESPFATNSTDASPLFVNQQSFDDDPDKWPSLFGDLQDAAQDAPAQEYIESPKLQPQPAPVYVAPAMSRNISSPGDNPSAPSSHQGPGRHALTSGVSAKRRTKPLPDIPIDDPNDTQAIKRRRNTLAARKSRSKRAEKMESLGEQVTRLEGEVEHWKSIALGMGYVE